jgi:hypothetical protein
MDDLNNGQAQGVLANMLQHLQEATPDSEKAFTLREEADEPSTDVVPVDGDVIELGGEFGQVPIRGLCAGSGQQ